VDLAQTGEGAGIFNLALISPNVVSSGGVGLGTGGSVGGQRPRDNDFIVDGVDNNDKTVSGPQIYISPESVAEFNLLTNQASAEFARSTGGQFITVTKSGGNDFHGSAFEFFRNKKLNSLDNLQKLAAITREENPRYDQCFQSWQYVPGSVNGVEPIATTGVSQINTVGQADFDVPSHVFNSHPRIIQLAVRFDF
jgi:hypothetical protein